MKKILINSILLTCLISSPSLLFVNGVNEEIKQEKQARWTDDFTDKDHPEKIYKEYYNVDRDAMPWDIFGDWVVPERFVVLNGSYSGMWHGDENFYKIDPTRPLFLVKESYYEDDVDNHMMTEQERTNWHETYENFFNYQPDKPGWYWYEDKWQFDESSWDIGKNTDWVNVTSRTPMRGIIPFWENTSQFNSYVLSETNNGTTDSSNLTYDSVYASYINDYVNSTEEKYPVIYEYLANPDLLYDIFITNDDSVEWILPEDYKLVEYDDLTNAFVGFDPTWNLLAFEEYMFDFIIWNWNVNIYPTKSEDIAYYDSLRAIDAGEITIVASGKNGITELRGDGMSMGDEFATWTIEEFNPLWITLTNAGYDGTYNSVDDISEYNQALSIDFDPQPNSSVKTKSPVYTWKNGRQHYSPYSGKDDYFEMYNPFNQQMNVNITPTTINFEGVNERFEDEFIGNANHKYFIETTLEEFKVEFEDWLLNSDQGLNKYFIEFYSDCHVNDYYNNAGGDGTAFLGHNRFQSGIYPVEDLREGDITISYSDQNGNEVTNEMRLGDVNQLNITIEFNEESDNAKLFDTTSATAETITFDTSSLESRDPFIPEPDEESSHLILILAIVGAVMAAIAVLAVVLTKKNKK